MKEVFVRIKSAGEETAFPATLSEEGGKRVLTGGEYVLTALSSRLTVERKGEIGYEMTFTEGGRHECKLTTPYGQSSFFYSVEKLKIAERSWSVLYKADSDRKYSMVRITVTPKEEP